MQMTLSLIWTLTFFRSCLQWRLIFNALEKCTAPLFLKLIFTEIRTWKSSWVPDPAALPMDINRTILNLFKAAEEKYGRSIVSHAVG